MVYKTNLKTGIITLLVRYLLFPFLIIGIGIMIAIFSAGGISTVLTLDNLFFIPICCLVLPFMIFVLFIIAYSKGMIYQMQIKITDNHIYIQYLKNPWKIGWHKIDISKIDYFLLNKHLCLSLISEDILFIELLVLSKSKHNRSEMEKVKKLLKEKGIKEITQDEFLELFKRGKIRLAR